MRFLRRRRGSWFKINTPISKKWLAGTTWGALPNTVCHSYSNHHPKQTSKSNSTHSIYPEWVKPIFCSLQNNKPVAPSPPLSTLLVLARICCFMLDTSLRQPQATSHQPKAISPTKNEAKPCQNIKKNTSKTPWQPRTDMCELTPASPQQDEHLWTLGIGENNQNFLTRGKRCVHTGLPLRGRRRPRNATRGNIQLGTNPTDQWWSPCLNTAPKSWSAERKHRLESWRWQARTNQEPMQSQ